MRATVHQLRAEPAATATVVIDRYRRLSAGLPGIQASAAALSQAEKQIKSFLGRGAKATMDQKTLEQLRSLGYIGGKQ